MRSRKSRKMLSMAVSISPDLYHKAVKERIEMRDTNFSRYVRGLIREDLRRCGMLDVEQPHGK